MQEIFELGYYRANKNKISRKMSTRSKNIYDNAGFFSAYATLPRSQHGLSAAPEWPKLRQMVLSDKRHKEDCLSGKRVLDLGCGYGWFSRWARDNGAFHIKAIDISHKMIARAREFEPQIKEHDNPIKFDVKDLETIKFTEQSDQGSYDLVYSSLTFHYIEDMARLYREIQSSLKRGGKLVFSVEHPICSAPIDPGPMWKLLKEEDQERNVWPLNCFADEGWRTTSWLGIDGVAKYHRTLETYVSLLLQNGFSLTGLVEWSPSLEDVAEHPEWAQERHRPYFLLISAEKV